MKTGLIIFHNDMNVENDNLSISTALKECDNILFLMLIRSDQIYLNEHNKNYFSEKALSFFLLATKNLNEEIENLTKKKNNLIMLIEEEHTLINFCKKHNITNVYWNKTFSEYSIKRDTYYKKELEKINIIVKENEDHYYLIPQNPDKQYKVFSAYLKFYSKQKIPELKENDISKTQNYTKIKYDFSILKLKQKLETDYELYLEPTTKKALELIKDFNSSKKDLVSYLSKFIQFGVGGSIRWYAMMLKKKKRLIVQLYWRSFYTNISQYQCNVFNSPQIYKILDNRYNHIKWINNQNEAKMFWNANSGYLYLDAHIRMLHATGYNYNMSRLVIICTAIKILGFDPFSKLEYAPQTAYSRLLGDCSSCLMVGNILWILGIYDTGFNRFTKGLIYGRTFLAPIRMKDNKEFELDFMIIRKYIPEVKHLSNKEICKWHKYKDEERKKILGDNCKTYPYKLLFNFEENVNRWKNHLANFK
jgi:deoxyribodipyrimidine photolyase